MRLTHRGVFAPLALAGVLRLSLRWRLLNLETLMQILTGLRLRLRRRAWHRSPHRMRPVGLRIELLHHTLASVDLSTSGL